MLSSLPRFHDYRILSRSRQWGSAMEIHRGVSKHNPYLYYPPRLLPILGYSDIPLVGGSRLSLLTIIILSHLLLTDEFPVANPIKHGRNYFVRRLHYAAEEVRSYTLYFPLHRKGNFRCLANSGLKAT